MSNDISQLDRDSTRKMLADAEKLASTLSILASVAPERVSGPFICGALGEPGTDGLHEAYMICSTYGADVTEIYRRVFIDTKDE